MASKTFIAGGVDNNWNTAGNWSPVASVPANGDDVIINASSPNCVLNVATNNLQSFDMTGYTNTLSGASTLNIGYSVAGTYNAIFAGTVTATGNITFGPSSGVTINFTANGKLGTVNQVGASGTGTVSQQDNLVLGASKTFTPATMVWNTNNNSIDAGFISLGAGTNTTLGTSTLTARSVGLVFLVNSSATLSAASSTIIVNDTSASLKTFAGAGKTYGTVTFSGDNIQLTGNNTFTTMNVNNANLATGLKIAAGSKQTVTNFSTNGSASNISKILSDTPGQFGVISVASGTVTVTYTSLTDNLAMGGATFDATSGTNVNGGGVYGWSGMGNSAATTAYAGTNSTDNGDNPGWTFTAPPVTPSGPALISTGRLPARRMVGVGL